MRVIHVGSETKKAQCAPVPRLGPLWYETRRGKRRVILAERGLIVYLESAMTADLSISARAYAGRELDGSPCSPPRASRLLARRSPRPHREVGEIIT